MFTVKYKFQGFQWFSFESLSTHSSYYVTESLYMFPCQWNYRPDHCIYGSNCQQAEQEGVFILHGNRGVYHDDKQPAFRAVYEAIQKVRASSQKSTLPYKGNKYSSVLPSYGKLCSVKYMRHSMQESQPKTQIENPSCTLK